MQDSERCHGTIETRLDATIGEEIALNILGKTFKFHVLPLNPIQEFKANRAGAIIDTKAHQLDKLIKDNKLDEAEKVSVEVFEETESFLKDKLALMTMNSKEGKEVIAFCEEANIFYLIVPQVALALEKKENQQ